jgi:hypothetical protein
MLKNTPLITKHVKAHQTDNPVFLRKIGDDGVITYSEYLFLLSVITKPRSGLSVAFSIIDVSRENTIMASEFSNVREAAEISFLCHSLTLSSISTIQNCLAHRHRQIAVPDFNATINLS